MRNKLYKLIRKYISKTAIFWRYRHLLQPEVWKSYKNDSINLRRLYYNELLDQYHLNSVFEFGCASGPNFLSIISHKKNIFFFGYDISKKAIKSINYNNNDKRLQFTSFINKIKIEKYLKINALDSFDLSIFDRVFYMLSEKDIKVFLKNFSCYLNYVVIDDFHSDDPKWDAEKYIYSKNYTKIFKEFGFKLLKIKESKIHSSTAQKYAKILIFKKRIL